MIGVKDFQRLAVELNTMTQPTIREWAERRGIEVEAFDAVIATAVNYLRDEIEEVMKQALSDADGDEENATVDIGDLVANACASCFALGWSAHEQFGGQPS